MADPVLVGIDVGTSSTKAVLLALGGDLLAVAAREYPVMTPRPGWAEQEPDAWVAAAVATVREAVARAGVDPSSVKGLALSGQMHGTVCVDDAGHPLRPAIIWADQRSDAEVGRVTETLGRERLAAWIGNPLATGFMLPTWLWLRAHEAGVAGAIRWLLLPKDYVRYRLTGEIGSEPSDAGSTGLLDPAARAWSVPLLAALELDSRPLPPMYASASVAGGLLPAVAVEMGLRPGTPVVFGGSDQALQALGNGVVAPGILSSTLGTGGQLFAPTERPVIDWPGPEEPGLRVHSFCHVVPDRWHVETAMLAAGLSLRWLRDQLSPGMSYSALADAAATVPAGSEGLLFQPYLAGERTPHMDPAARGSFVGLTIRHTRAHLIRALMEGVVLGMGQGLDLLHLLGVPVDTVIASGGATQHPLWLQLQADIYARAIRRTLSVEAAATGAAMLAGIGTGMYTSAADAIACVVRRHEEVVEPDPVRVRIYQSQAALFRDLYGALAPTDHELGRVTTSKSQV
jgi:xylulokinase